jgi:hypothetical protein
MSNITKINSVDDLSTLGQVFVKSGFFNDTKDAAQAIVKIMAGQELGFAPIASMTGVYIVKGKVSLSANLIAAAIKRSGRYDYRVRQMDANECAIEFFETVSGVRESLGVSSYTIAEAKAANLTGNATWKNFPKNMLFARAISNGAKWYCPDIFGGPVYTPDELGAQINGETGEMITAPAAPAIVAVPAAPALPPADEEYIEEPLPPTEEQIEDLLNLCDQLLGTYTEEQILKALNGWSSHQVDDLTPEGIGLGFTAETIEVAIAKAEAKVNTIARRLPDGDIKVGAISI